MGTKFKRRRLGKTDYKKRLILLKSKKDRLVIRVMSNQVVAQVVSFDVKGDIVRMGATSLELKKYGWKGHGGNVCSAYLTGLLCGYKAKKKGISSCVLDVGLHTPINGSNIFAALKGAIDSGLDVPYSEGCLPPENRIRGELIAAYRKKDDVPKQFDEAKQKIIKEFSGSVDK